MGVPNVIRSGVGFRHVQLISLDADGYPNATDTSAYAGAHISGARSLALNDPEPQQIVHAGDDRPFALDVLPPTEPISGELTVGKTNDTVDALLSDDNSFTVGETKMFPLGSDNRGDENQVAVLCYRQTIDTDPDSGNFGSRRWEFRLFPKCFLISRESGLTGDPEEKMYTVRPQFIKKHLWGATLSTSTEGAEQAQGFRGIAEYKPRIVAFDGGGSTQTGTYSFESGFPAVNTDKITVFVDGTEQTSGVTLATNQIEFGTDPATTEHIVVFYEHDQ